jgi:Tfp pilus assembly protein PilP
MRFVKPSANLIHARGAFVLLAALAFGAASGMAAFAQAKPAPPAPAKAQAKAKAPAKAAAKRESTQSTASAGKRDPFQPLISKEAGGKGVPENLPPGPGGLVISTLRVDGIVRSPSGMIAVVSNPQQRVYFIREGANLYDGTVERISLDGVMFRERGKDPFGKAIDRQVMKRLYPRAGEQ